MVGFRVTLFFGCVSMGAERYGHVKAPVEETRR
jgi:hypothetical protein